MYLEHLKRKIQIEDIVETTLNPGEENVILALKGFSVLVTDKKNSPFILDDDRFKTHQQIHNLSQEIYNKYKGVRVYNCSFSQIKRIIKRKTCFCLEEVKSSF